MFCRGCKKALFSTAAGPWAGRRCFWGKDSFSGHIFCGRRAGAPGAGLWAFCCPRRLRAPRVKQKCPARGRLAPGGASLHIKAERRACEGAAAPWRAARRAVAQFPAFRPRKGGRRLCAAERHSCKFCPVSRPKFYAGRKLNLRPRRGKIINSAPVAPAFGGRNPAPAAFGPR